MKEVYQKTARSLRVSELALLGVVCAVGLSSCGDEEGSWCGHKHVRPEPPAEEKAPTVEVAPAPEEPRQDLQKELFDYMVYTIADKVRGLATQPAWRAEVRDMRNKLEAYYDRVKEEGADPMEVVRLGMLLADTTHDMTAYPRAQGIYENVLKDWEALPEDVRTSVAARRIRSALANRMGSCCLMQRQFAEALPYYEKALELDKELFDSLAPADDQPLPEGDELGEDLENVSADLLSSYRCLGECQELANDPEQARETYQKGHELATRMKHLRPSMSIQYIRLLTDLGNLESRAEDPRKALAAWARAAKIADMLRRSDAPSAIRVRAAQYRRELEPSMKAAQHQLISQQQEEEVQQQPAE